ncbi:MAG TPA: hypothetical protein VG734_18345 [Lacunisphaera sp.]|nr:hypothetical protein [Lacunisphaera sp.]
MRTRICLYVLLLLPLTVYWQTVFPDYGLRDDYGFLREAEEEPGKLVKYTASAGRPLYGALLESSYAAVGQVDFLWCMRLTSVLLLTVLAVVLWRQLYTAGWNEVEAAAVGLGVALLPASQAVVASAAGWPQALTLLLGMAGFSAIETEIERGGLKRVVALAGGLMIYTAAGLIYQSNVLFALVPLVGVYLVRTGREPLSDLKWALIHLATIVAGLLLGYLLVHSLFSNGVFEPSDRLRFDTNPLTKLVWFFAHPLPNALALFALADDNHFGAVYYGISIAGVVAVISLAFRRSFSLVDGVEKRRWKVCLFAMPFVMHAISLAAAERFDGYRTLFALSGLFLVLVIYACHGLLADWKVKTKLEYPLIGLVFLTVAFAANRNTHVLLGMPQESEWEMMKNETLRANIKTALKVYVITPTLADRSTERIYRDEFGWVSSSDPKVAAEMFKAAVRQRFPGGLPKGASYTVAAGPAAPAVGTYDLVIDMRRVRALRGG